MTPAEVVSQIDSIISWYSQNRDQTNDINMMLEKRDLLSIASYEVARIAGTAKQNYEYNHWNRKVTFSKLVVSFREQGENVSSAEHLATQHESYSKLYQAEYEAKGKAEKTSLVLRQINEVLSAMNQRISFLKQDANTKPIRQ